MLSRLLVLEFVFGIYPPQLPPYPCVSRYYSIAPRGFATKTTVHRHSRDPRPPYWIHQTGHVRATFYGLTDAAIYPSGNARGPPRCRRSRADGHARHYYEPVATLAKKAHTRGCEAAAGPS